MSVMKVVVKWGKQKYDLEIDTEEGVELLQAQLFTLTGVPIDRQKVLIKGKKLTLESDLSKLIKKNGTKLMLMGTATALPKEPTKKIVFVEDLTEDQKVSLGTEKEGGGLHNLGNTCYMNSTIQVLRGVKDLKKDLAKYALTGQPRGENDLYHVITSQMGLLFSRQDNSKDPIVPGVFCQAFRKCFPQFNETDQQGRHKQQDADECLTQLLTTLSGKLTTGIPKSSSESGVRNMVDHLFSMKMTATQQCDENPKEAAVITTERVQKLQCFINVETNYMYQGIQSSLSEQLEKKSPTLNRGAVYTKTLKIGNLPPFLIVQYVRFFWKKEISQKAKILRRVKFPEIFDIFQFCDSDLKTSLTYVRNLQRAAKDKKMGLKALDWGGKGKGAKKKNQEEKKDGGAPKDKTKDSGPSDIYKVGERMVYQGSETVEIVKVYHDDPEEKYYDIKLADGTVKQTVPSHLTKLEEEEEEKEPERLPTTGNYKIIGVVTHKGRSADGGHYIGWSRDEGDAWRKYDDDVVSATTTEEILKLCGGGDWHTNYLMMYQRVDDVEDSWFTKQPEPATTTTTTTATSTTTK